MKLIINARRNGYSTEQCGETLTVGELIGLLSDFNEDARIYLSHDNGYTFGEIKGEDFEEIEKIEEEEK